MDDIFSDIQCNVSIVAQDKFEKTTGVNVDAISIETKQLDFNIIKKNNNKGTGVIEIADIKTSNTLIENTQKKVKEDIKAEKNRLANVDNEFPYIKNEVMTNAEKQLYHFLLNNLCQVERIAILPKVRLADIISVDSKVTLDKKAFYKIAYKHVDFLICKKDTLETICVIELDDYTHETADAQERDVFVMQALLAAGIQTVRIKTKIKTIEKSDLAYADEVINTALAPKCPRCGLTMLPKIARDRHRFYACADNKNCRMTIDIDPRGEELP